MDEIKELIQNIAKFVIRRVDRKMKIVLVYILILLQLSFCSSLRSDLNDDDIVDFADFAIFAKDWLKCKDVNMVDLRSYCVAQYKMNDNDAESPTVTDSQGYSNGTAQQNTSLLHTNGKVGGALTFNGSSDYIDTNDAFESTLQDSFSIAFWCKPTDGRPATSQYLLGINASGVGFYTYIFHESTGKIQTLLWDAAGAKTIYLLLQTGSAVFVDGPPSSWVFIVAVYGKSGSNVIGDLYIDGLLKVSESKVGDFDPVFSANLFLGNTNSGEVDSFNGSLDNVMIFNKALDQDEIDFLYNSGAGTEKLREQGQPIPKRFENIPHASFTKPQRIFGR